MVLLASGECGKEMDKGGARLVEFQAGGELKDD